MILDDIDELNLNSNFDKELLDELDYNNVQKIYEYLIKEGVYYAKDIFISNADLFLFSLDEFKELFNKLKDKLGPDYIELLGDDSSLIEIMYE